MFEEGYFVRDIEWRTGLGKSTVHRIKKEVDIDNENNPGGHPPKLSTHDKASIIHQIRSGKLDTAVQGTHFITSTLCHPVHPTPVRRAPGEWYQVCYKEESTHVEEDSLTEAARVCTTA